MGKLATSTDGELNTMATNNTAPLTLIELITKQETDGGLTAAEHTQLLNLLSGKTAAAKTAATAAGILVLSDTDAATLGKLSEAYQYQAFGQLAWSEMMLRNTCDRYNTFAVKNKLPQCSDYRKLGEVLNSLPSHFLPTVAKGKREAEARYVKAWADELTKLDAAVTKEVAAGEAKPLHSLTELTSN